MTSANIRHIDDQISTQAIGRLLAARPDLALRRHRSTAELRSYAANPSLLRHCRLHLNHFDLVVFDALAAMGRQSFEDLQYLIGDPPAGHLRESLARLADRWMVRETADAWQIDNVGHWQIAYPAGLGSSARTLLERGTAHEVKRHATHLGLGKPASQAKAIDIIVRWMENPENIRHHAKRAPDSARELLERLSQGPPEMEEPYSHRFSEPGFAWLRDNGLLYRSTWSTHELPREVALAMRGGRVIAESPADPPPVITTAVNKASVTNAFHQARKAVSLIEIACQAVEHLQPKALKSGAIGVRDVKRLATHADVSESTMNIALEVANGAGLVASFATIHEKQQKGRGYVPPETIYHIELTERFASWLEQSTGERWLHIARSWLMLEHHPSMSGGKDANDKTINTFDSPRSELFACRRVTALKVFRSLSGRRFDDTAGNIARFVFWHAPLAFTFSDEAIELIVAELFNEAELLGFVDNGTLTSSGHHVLDGSFAQAVQEIDSGAPPLINDIAVQGDGTIVIAGMPEASLLAKLAQFADVVSRDTAVILRITEQSLRKAIDAGLDAGIILEHLEQHAVKAVPQAVKYLIEDVARRHGHVKVGVATAYVTAEDHVVLADVVRHRALKKHNLRLLAPTVAVSESDSSKLFQALQDAGFMPVLEDGVARIKAEGRDISEQKVQPKVPASYERPSNVHTLLVDENELAQSIIDGNSVLPDEIDEHLVKVNIIEVLREAGAVVAGDEVDFSELATNAVSVEQVMSEDAGSYFYVAAELIDSKYDDNLVIFLRPTMHNERIHGCEMLHSDALSVAVENIKWMIRFDILAD